MLLPELTSPLAPTFTLQPLSPSPIPPYQSMPPPPPPPTTLFSADLPSSDDEEDADFAPAPASPSSSTSSSSTKGGRKRQKVSHPPQPQVPLEEDQPKAFSYQDLVKSAEKGTAESGASEVGKEPEGGGETVTIRVQRKFAGEIV